jgi:hypothetical protein
MSLSHFFYALKRSIQLNLLYSVLWFNTVVVVTIDTVGLSISHFWSVLCYCHYSTVLLPLQYCVAATTVIVNSQNEVKNETQDSKFQPNVKRNAASKRSFLLPTTPSRCWGGTISDVYWAILITRTPKTWRHSNWTISVAASPHQSRSKTALCLLIEGTNWVG